MIYRLLIIAFFFANATLVFSQGPSTGIDPEKPLNLLSMDEWTGRDGLVSNNLTSVNQASSKFLWITSFNGILRFDGVHFELFDKENIPFLNSNGFYKSYEDRKGNLWFTSQSSGLIKYSNHKFEQVLAEGSNSLSVRCVFEDTKGVLWVGTNNEGIYRLEDNALVKYKIDGLSHANIMGFEEDSEGKVWIATGGNGLCIISQDKVQYITTRDGLTSNAITALRFGPENTMYIGTINGINYYDGNRIHELSLFKDLEINDMMIDSFWNLWVASEQGLYKYNIKSQIFDSFTEKDGLPASQISTLCFDHENSLWISTKKAGLIRFRNGFFKNVTTKEGLSSNNVNIVVEHDHKFYVGCDDGLINVVNGLEISQLKFNHTFYNIGIRDINFWGDEIIAANYRGLMWRKGAKEQYIDLTRFGYTNDIRRILRTSADTIWLGTRSSGVLMLINLKIAKVYNYQQGLHSDYVLALEKDQHGNVYVGTHSGGMSIILKNGKLKHYPIEKGKSGILIFNIELLPDGSALVATNIGLYKFAHGAFKKIELDEKLRAETVFDVIMENGNIWLSSNIGLIKIQNQEVEDFLNGDIPQVSGRLFDRYDGMSSQECTGATRMLLSTHGNLWVPTLGGVAILDPKHIDKNQQIPNVYITDVRTDFHNRDLRKGALTIEPGVTRYEFDFTSLSFVAPPKVRFRYMLEGVDKEWIDAGNERNAVYTNLHKGNYTFKVIASNNDGLWNETGAAINIKIKPFFYETTIFYILVALALGLIIWGIFVWRLKNIEKVNRELRKLNEELDRFVYSASHDLRAPLSSVLGLVGIAKLESTIEKKDECLGMIDNSIQKLDGFINDIIDYSRNQRIEVQVEKIDLEKEVQDVFEELKYLDKEDKISRYITAEEKRHFMTDGRRISVVLKNLIANAFRYHDLEKQDPYIKVHISYKQSIANIRISDNGIGIKEEHLSNIFQMFYRADEGSKGSGLGLYIVKETLGKLGGSISVTSERYVGTSFDITIPSMRP